MEEERRKGVGTTRKSPLLKVILAGSLLVLATAGCSDYRRVSVLHPLGRFERVRLKGKEIKVGTSYEELLRALGRPTEIVGSFDKTDQGANVVYQFKGRDYCFYFEKGKQVGVTEISIEDGY